MKWYFIDKKYINFLKKFDYKVSNVDYGENKMKGFIGVVLQKENNTNYFAPITSYKKKFEGMPDNIDFIKIFDNNSKILGALDLNNMIPVPDNLCVEVTFDNLEEFRTFKNNQEKIKYWNLLKKEQKFLNKKKYIINNNANRLYNIVKNKQNHPISKRCCNFKLLEEKCMEYENLLLETS